MRLLVLPATPLHPHAATPPAITVPTNHGVKIQPSLELLKRAPMGRPITGPKRRPPHKNQWSLGDFRIDSEGSASSRSKSSGSPGWGSSGFMRDGMTAAVVVDVDAARIGRHQTAPEPRRQLGNRTSHRRFLAYPAAVHGPFEKIRKRSDTDENAARQADGFFLKAKMRRWRRG